MPEKQLRFLAPAKPLNARFGADFFKVIPRSPGVYKMFDGAERIIYVGQSKDLRERLNSYRQIHPDRSSRKLVKLVHTVARIDWEECETPSHAKVRENLLLRTHRPKFNSMNVWPKAHCFVGVKWSDEALELSFIRAEPDLQAQYYGAFKSGCLAGYTALLRLLWTSVHPTGSIHDLPRVLLTRKAPKQFALKRENISASWDQNTKQELLHRFLSGESEQLVDEIRKRLPVEHSTSLFHRNLITTDLAEVEGFFHRGPGRNLKLRTKHKLAGELIGQEILDDLTSLES